MTFKTAISVIYPSPYGDGNDVTNTVKTHRIASQEAHPNKKSPTATGRKNPHHSPPKNRDTLSISIPEKAPRLHSQHANRPTTQNGPRRRQAHP